MKLKCECGNIIEYDGNDQTLCKYYSLGVDISVKLNFKECVICKSKVYLLEEKKSGVLMSKYRIVRSIVRASRKVKLFTPISIDLKEAIERRIYIVEKENDAISVVYCELESFETETLARKYLTDLKLEKNEPQLIHEEEF